jgi:hypothetical protein
MMFDCRNGVGSLSELSLCDSAAKFTTTSASATRRSASSASAVEPSTKEIASATGSRLDRFAA